MKPKTKAWRHKPLIYVYQSPRYKGKEKTLPSHNNRTGRIYLLGHSDNRLHDHHIHHSFLQLHTYL